MTPGELRRRLERGDELLLLDVREEEEWRICRLEGSVHIPLGELGGRIRDLDPEREVVCICHHGQRSAHAALALARADFELVHNLVGGLDRWARDVDPRMPRY